MPTFHELQQQLIDLRNRKAILMMLVEHIDQNFRSVAGKSPKNAIKTDEGSIVPELAIEEVASTLNEQVQTIEDQITTILNTTPGQPTPQA